MILLDTLQYYCIHIPLCVVQIVNVLSTKIDFWNVWYNYNEETVVYYTKCYRYPELNKNCVLITRGGRSSVGHNTNARLVRVINNTNGDLQPTLDSFNAGVRIVLKAFIAQNLKLERYREGENHLWKLVQHLCAEFLT